MKVKELMTRDVQAILPETSLAEAWRLMHELKVRHLPVVREGRLAGIVSDRDFVGWVTRARDGGLIFPAVTAGEVMTLNPVVCTQGAAVAEIARTMVSRQLDCVPILGEGNALVGLVTSTDLMLLLMEAREQLPVTFHVRPPVHA